MPFTPFHFGPGLLVKSALPRHFSWTAFVVSQVIIDCETLYYLAQRAYPVHRLLHTFVGGTIAGFVTGIALIGLRSRFGKWGIRFGESSSPSSRSEVSNVGILTGTLVGGISHPLLDGIMHGDIRPFMPWTEANPLLNLFGLGTLHLACLASGILGLILMVAWSKGD